MITQGYQLAYGGHKPEVRDFPLEKMNDAVTRFANKVQELDEDPTVHAAWVNITLVTAEHRTTLLAWTKTSNECPTIEGDLHIDIL
jgi:hypothetical protein